MISLPKTASELMKAIEDALPLLDGWTTPERACEYAAMIIANRPLVSVEIGVWGGRGTFAMAMAHRFIGTGHVVAIDPWSANASKVGQTGADEKWWADQLKHDIVHARFMSNLQAMELADWIDVQRKPSNDAEVPNEIGLLVVDGNHAEQAVTDVDRFGPQVPMGGYVYLDDLNWTHGGVRRAAEILIAMGFHQTAARNEGAFFQRRRSVG